MSFMRWYDTFIVGRKYLLRQNSFIVDSGKVNKNVILVCTIVANHGFESTYVCDDGEDR